MQNAFIIWKFNALHQWVGQRYPFNPG